MGHYFRRRHSSRVSVHLEAEIIYDSIHYAAFIENISEHSISAKIAHVEHTWRDMPETEVTLIMKLNSGKSFQLQCNKIWSNRNTPHSLIERVAVEIIHPPLEYIHFYHALSHGDTRNGNSIGDTLFDRRN